MSEHSSQIRIKSSWVWAVAIAVVVSAWMLSGLLRDTGAQEAGGAQTAVADGETAAEQTSQTDEEETAFRVRAQTFYATPHQSFMRIRGRTEAIRTVHVRAETVGRVASLPVEKGDRVAEGDLLCVLAADDRPARLAEAKALRNQRELEWKAARDLVRRGVRSETQTAAAEAAYESSKAMVAAMEIELGHTQIRAPFDGIVDGRDVEIGDYLRPGDVCAVVVDTDPYLVVGEVSEREVSFIEIGTPATARIVGGTEVTGRVRFVSARAEEATRTFRVELVVNEATDRFRDGLTAEIFVPRGEVMAHLVTPAILGLSERGEIGVRTVSEEGLVAFAPLTVLEDTSDGVWVTGLPDQVTIITVGQDFVVPGQRVEVEFGPEVQPQSVSALRPERPAPVPAAETPGVTTENQAEETSEPSADLQGGEPNEPPATQEAVSDVIVPQPKPREAD